ncbi:protein pygopus-like [Nematolebias whitei]|uniref:protein pygopus-like n=1 Tax=Nematolebias whitei TaxID=451745 RepID=UPI0018980A4F|nr:protein pygopus-like [Nematolebias whitei]
MAAAFLVIRVLLFFWLTDVTCSSSLIGETFQLKEQDDLSKSLERYQQRNKFPVNWPPRVHFSNFPISPQSGGKICSDMKPCGTGRYVIQSRIIPSEFAEERRRKVLYGPKHGPKPSFMFYISVPIPHQLTAKGSHALYHHDLHHPPHPPKHPGPGPHHVHQGTHNPHEPKRHGPGPHHVHQGTHYPYQPKLPGLGPHHPPRRCPLHGPCPQPHKHRRPYSAKLDMSRVMHNMFGHRVNKGRQMKPDELSIHQTDKKNLGSKGHDKIKA